MNVGSLFSGAGLMDYGLACAGFEHAWFCESDPYCRRVLELRWPGVPIFEDVRTLESPERVALLAGGFPCQDLSAAGRRAGITGERSGLWAHFARLIGELRPGYVLVENVPGLLTGGMGRVLGDLAALGYDAEWDCLPAAAFGAPHLRARIFILAYPGGGRGQGDGLLAGRDSAGGSGATVADPDPEGELQPGGPLGEVGRRVGDGGQPVAYTERSGWAGRTEDTGRGSLDREAQERCEGSGQPAGRGAPGGTEALADSEGEPVRPGLRAGGEAGERRGRPCDSGSPRRVQDTYGRTVESRRLRWGTPRAGSAWWWAVEPDVGRVAHGVPARLDRLAALGNGVVPQISEWIGRRILEAERVAA